MSKRTVAILLLLCMLFPCLTVPFFAGMSAVDKSEVTDSTFISICYNDMTDKEDGQILRDNVMVSRSVEYTRLTDSSGRTYDRRADIEVYLPDGYFDYLDGYEIDYDNSYRKYRDIASVEHGNWAGRRATNKDNSVSYDISFNVEDADFFYIGYDETFDSIFEQAVEEYSNREPENGWNFADDPVTVKNSKNVKSVVYHDRGTLLDADELEKGNYVTFTGGAYGPNALFDIVYDTYEYAVFMSFDELPGVYLKVVFVEYINKTVELEDTTFKEAISSVDEDLENIGENEINPYFGFKRVYNHFYIDPGRVYSVGDYSGFKKIAENRINGAINQKIGEKFLDLSSLVKIKWRAPEYTGSVDGSQIQTGNDNDVSGLDIRTESDASSYAGDSEFNMPAAIITGVAATGAAIGAAVSAAGSGKSEEQTGNDRKKYKMIVSKDFGDTIKTGGKPVTVRARIVEETSSGTVERTDLTEGIGGSASGGLHLDSFTFDGTHVNAVVSSPADTKADSGAVTFVYSGKGGSFSNKINFRLADKTRILFPDQAKSSSEMFLDVIAGDSGVYRVRFYFENAVTEPKSIRFESDKRFDIRHEPEEHEMTYYAIISNNTQKKENTVFGKPETVSVKIIAEFEDEAPVNGYFNVVIAPEGLTVSCLEVRDDRMVINAYEAENVTEFDYKIQPTTFEVFYALSVTEGGYTKAEYLKGDRMSPVFGKLTGETEYADNFNRKFSWDIDRNRSDDGIYCFIPQTVLPQSGDPYKMEITVSCTVNGKKEDRNIPVMLKGETIKKMPESWEKEKEALKKDILYFGLNSNSELRKTIRNIQNLSEDDIHLLRKAIIAEGTAYYMAEGAAYQTLGNYYETCEFALNTVKWICDQAFTYACITYCGGNPYPEAFLTPFKDLVTEFLVQCVYGGSSVKGSSLVQTAMKGAERAFAYQIRDMVVTGDLRKAGGALAIFMFITWLEKYTFDEKCKGNICKSLLATVNAAFSASVKAIFFAKFKEALKVYPQVADGIKKFFDDKLPTVIFSKITETAANASDHTLGLLTKYLTEVAGMTATVFIEGLELKEKQIIEKTVNVSRYMDHIGETTREHDSVAPDEYGKKAMHVYIKSMQEITKTDIFDLDLKIGKYVVRVNIVENAESLAKFLWNAFFGLFLPVQTRKEAEAVEYRKDAEEYLEKLKTRMDEEAIRRYYDNVNRVMQGD